MIFDVFYAIRQNIKRDILTDSAAEISVFIIVRHCRRYNELLRNGIDIGIREEIRILCLGILVPRTGTRIKLSGKISIGPGHEFAVLIALPHR